MPKMIVSIGKIEDVAIADDLPYVMALRQLVRDATGTGVTFDPAVFYSETTLELHNFVATIRYRFLKGEYQDVLAYEVLDRPNCLYREVRFDGVIIESHSWDAEAGSFLSKEDDNAQRERRRRTLTRPLSVVT